MSKMDVGALSTSIYYLGTWYGMTGQEILIQYNINNNIILFGDPTLVTQTLDYVVYDLLWCVVFMKI